MGGRVGARQFPKRKLIPRLWVLGHSGEEGRRGDYGVRSSHAVVIGMEDL